MKAKFVMLCVSIVLIAVSFVPIVRANNIDNVEIENLENRVALLENAVVRTHSNLMTTVDWAG